MLSKLPPRAVLALVDAIKMFQMFTITWATVYSGTDICAESIDSTLNNFMVLWNVSDDSKGSLREQSYQSICCWCYHKKNKINNVIKIPCRPACASNNCSDENVIS